MLGLGRVPRRVNSTSSPHQGTCSLREEVAHRIIQSTCAAKRLRWVGHMVNTVEGGMRDRVELAGWARSPWRGRVWACLRLGWDSLWGRLSKTGLTWVTGEKHITHITHGDACEQGSGNKKTGQSWGGERYSGSPGPWVGKIPVDPDSTIGNRKMKVLYFSHLVYEDVGLRIFVCGI